MLMRSLMIANRPSFFLKRVALGLIAILISAVFLVLASPQEANAANWTNNTATASIEHNGNTYRGSSNGPLVSDGGQNSPPGVPSGAKYYISSGNQNPATGSLDVKVIWFPADADVAAATSANYLEADGSTSGAYSNARNQSSIEVTPRSEAGEVDNGGENTAENTCQVEGIGWFVCPVSMHIAKAMDFMFEAVKSMLLVPPMLGMEAAGSLYDTWAAFRSFANVAFVIAFLIIIYSHLTSSGVSNYGIKKLLPRILISALLVNISYWILALAIDVSNIAGTSLQHVFNILRENMNMENPNSFSTWESVVSVALMGVTGAVGGLTALSSIAAAGSGAIYLILPALFAGLISIIVAFVILAARQALIIVLVVLAPLAFAAYLLPNTESWFNRWRSSLVTMMVFFPIISILFGGSQLASAILIANSADNVTIIILAMFVQVAPLVLTPFLIRFSGSLISRVAGMTASPLSGMKGKVRDFSQSRFEYSKARNLAKPAGNNFMRRWGQSNEMQKRVREAEMNQNRQRFDNAWKNTDAYSSIYGTSRMLDEEGKVVDNRVQAAYESRRGIVGSDEQRSHARLVESDSNLQAATNNADASYKRTVLEGTTAFASAEKLKISELNIKEATAEADTRLEQARGRAGSDYARAFSNSKIAEDNLSAATSNADALYSKERGTVGTRAEKSFAAMKNAEINLQAANLNADSLYDEKSAMLGSSAFVANQKLRDAITKADIASLNKENNLQGFESAETKENRLAIAGLRATKSRLDSEQEAREQEFIARALRLEKAGDVAGDKVKFIDKETGAETIYSKKLGGMVNQIRKDIEHTAAFKDNLVNSEFAKQKHISDVFAGQMNSQPKLDSLKSQLQTAQSELAKATTPALQALYKNNIDHLKSEISKIEPDVNKSIHLQQIAGGINGLTGGNRSVARAFHNINKLNEENMANATAMINESGTPQKFLTDLYKTKDGAEFTYTDDKGNKVGTGIRVTEELRLAAASEFAKYGPVDQVKEFMRHLKLDQNTDASLRNIIADSISSRSDKPVEWGQGFMGQLRSTGIQGGYTKDSEFNFVKTNLLAGGFDIKQMTTISPDDLKLYNKTGDGYVYNLVNEAKSNNELDGKLKEAAGKLYELFNNDSYANQKQGLGKSTDGLKEMLETLKTAGYVDQKLLSKYPEK